MADFRLIQSVYHLLLGLWLGAMVMLVVGATASFAFVRGLDGILMVSLNGWSGPLVDSGAEGFLAGGFVGAMLGRLAMLQLVCAFGLALCVLAQLVWFPEALVGGRNSKRQGVRVFFLGVPAMIVLFNLLVVTPGIDQHRDAKYNPGTPPEAAALAEKNFDLYHGLSTKTYGVSTLMLAGAMVMTPWCLREPTVDGNHADIANPIDPADSTDAETEVAT